MALKLFRSTGYHSILAPGESRVGTHPGWLILATSLWIGFACNIVLWRHLRSLDTGGTSLGRTLLAGAFIAAACATLLSLLGWRRTLKQAATALLLLAALSASSLWVQGIPIDGKLLDRGLRTLLLPPWPGLLRWQFPALLIALGLLPMLWVWQLQVRRLPGPEQLAANAAGMLLGMITLAGSGWLLLK